MCGDCPKYVLNGLQYDINDRSEYLGKHFGNAFNLRHCFLKCCHHVLELFVIHGCILTQLIAFGTV